ncbi:hypothetical protein FA15DRAFT_559556, partial [Coprinopsis marcescibilis]
LPSELLDLIIGLYVHGCRLSSPSQYFNDIKALSLVSYDIRQTVFRHFFRDILPTSSRHWDGILNILDAQSTTRTLSHSRGGFYWVRYGPFLRLGSIKAYPKKLQPLHCLAYLRRLSIDLVHEGVNTQAHSMKGFLSGLNAVPQLDISLNLQSLSLTKVAYIDVYLLKMIVGAFPALHELSIETTSRLELKCCPNCYEDSLTRTIHSPIPRQVASIEALTQQYGSVLRGLKYLKRLHLGVFLSSEEYIENHIAHVSNWADMQWRFEAMPSCPICRQSLEVIRRDELLASLRMAQYVGALESVGWSTCCGTAE